MKYILLTRDMLTEVSDEDYDYLIKYLWHALSGGAGTFYAASWKLGSIVLMHHLVLSRMGIELSYGLETDHEDRNGLNNQRENLRVITKSLNMFNRKIPKSNTSGYRCVIYHGRINRWTAVLGLNGKKVHLGSFVDIDDAIKARKAGEIKYLGAEIK